MQSPRRTAGLSGSELAEGLGAQRAVELQILLFCLALEALALLKGLPAGAALVAGRCGRRDIGSDREAWGFSSLRGREVRFPSIVGRIRAQLPPWCCKREVNNWSLPHL